MTGLLRIHRALDRFQRKLWVKITASILFVAASTAFFAPVLYTSYTYSDNASSGASLVAERALGWRADARSSSHMARVGSERSCTRRPCRAMKARWLASSSALTPYTSTPMAAKSAD